MDRPLKGLFSGAQCSCCDRSTRSGPLRSVAHSAAGIPLLLQNLQSLNQSGSPSRFLSKTTPRVLLGSSEGGRAATGAGATGATGTAVTNAAGSAAGSAGDSAVSAALSDLSAAVSLWFAPLKAVGLSHSANLDQ